MDVTTSREDGQPQQTNGHSDANREDGFHSIARCRRARAQFDRRRVRAGLRNARANVLTLGRPRAVVDATTVDRLRSQGASWRAVANQLGVGAWGSYIAQARADERR